MNAPKRKPVVEVVSEPVAAILRQKTIAEKLEMAGDMWRSAQLIVEAAIRAEHPDWHGDQLETELFRRMSGQRCPS